MMNVRAWSAAVVCGAFVVLAAASWSPAGDYISSLGSGEIRAAMADQDADRSLLEEIRKEAKQRYIPPVDASVDRWFRAIPAYDGREVDVEATYKKALQAPGADIPFQYKPVKPAKSLESYPLEPIYMGNPAKPAASFMINVAWGNEYLDVMLDTLKRNGVKATFFLDGSWLKKYPEEARKIRDGGHEIGNHAYTHPDMSKLGMEQQRSQIQRTSQLIEQTLGVKSVWFAPPSGSFNSLTVKAAREQGMSTVLWTLDTVDWTKPDPGAVVTKIAKGIKPGTLILMHPTASSRDALQGMINVAKRKGLQLGTVSETLSERRLEAAVESGR
ncbi:polysaccharide deacetylase family protein [Paenibacillus pasadenensis]|uniref:polysaccharide deacetylase family protein n=1 Tax=Paenibacillus pasadenensis TaxID=217090 RepID=UPI00203FBB98|nr:polysaccharide deacetylase family protein [Paenibacillus pasadenensis]MCM3745959.1 polysaccharide deacetylase family protein [Paenibacillus pasadenensis]